MGAAESIFYEEEELPPSPEAQRQYPPQHPPPGRHPVVVGRGAHVARRPKQKGRPVPPAKLLQGQVLGLPGVGKRTLLERLKGRDPFSEPQPNGNPPPQESTEHSSLQAVIPYQPPEGLKMLDRIQIKVQASNEVVITDDRIDFVVVLINPRDDPRQVQMHISKMISDLLQAQQAQLQQSSDDATQNNPTTLALRMCFLVNFRDVHNSKKKGGIQEGEVQQLTVDLLKQCAKQIHNPEQVMLQFGTISLYNCYGLSTLHHFLFDTYLRIKRKEIELQLSLVDEQLTKSREVPRVKYKEFLKMVNQVEEDDDDDEEENTHHQPHHKGKQKMKNNSKGPPPEGRARQQQDPIPSRQANAGPVENEQGRSADVNQKQRMDYDNPPSAPTSGNAVDALEAFLASDDEEEGPAKATPPSGTTSGDTDDDDDDDFYYNEQGERCSLRNRGKSKPKQAATVEKQAMNDASPKPSLGDANAEDRADDQTDDAEDDQVKEKSKKTVEDQDDVVTPNESDGKPVNGSGQEDSQVDQETMQGSDSAASADATKEDLPPQEPSPAEEGSSSAKGSDKEEEPQDSGHSSPPEDGEPVGSDEDIDDEKPAGEPSKPVADAERNNNAVDPSPQESHEATHDSDSNHEQSSSVSGEQGHDRENEAQSETDSKDNASPGSDEEALADGTPENDVMANAAGETDSKDNEESIVGAAPLVYDSEDEDGETEMVPKEAKASSGDPTKAVASIPSDNHSDEEDEFFVDDTGADADVVETNSFANIPKGHPKDGDDNSEDEDEFFIDADDDGEQEENGTMTSVVDPKDYSDPKPSATPASKEAKETAETATAAASNIQNDEPPASEPGQSGFSSAAQAAIAAAQKEAELMLAQATKPKKEKKKKKEGKAKKEKKKKSKKTTEP